MPDEDHAIFHFVADGGPGCERDGAAPTRLELGDFLLAAPRVAHPCRAARGRALPQGPRAAFEKVSGRAMLLATAATASARCSRAAACASTIRPRIRWSALMPEVLHVRGTEDGEAFLMRQMLAAMGSEALNPRPGGTTVMLRLADILVIHAIRWWIDAGADDRTGLARRAARSADRPRAGADPPPAGARLDGRRPRRQRPHVALGVLGSLHGAGGRAAAALPDALAHAPRGAVAARGSHQPGRRREPLGYESEPSFSRAFKRHIGVPPGAVRRGRATH